MPAHERRGAEPNAQNVSDTFCARVSLLVDNVGSLVTNDPELGEGPLGLIEDAAIVFGDDGAVAWAGRGAGGGGR